MNKTSSPLTRYVLTVPAAFLIAALLMLGGCSPLALINSVTSDQNFTVNQDIAYGPGPRQKLDVYEPTSRNLQQPAKVAIFFYGGSWQSGKRQDYLFVAESLTRAGIVTVIPDYAVYPEAHYPVFIEDGARAVKWVRQHIAEYGGDPNAIYLIGHSAGAHIAAMLALNRDFLGPEGIAGMIGLAGPYDFLPFNTETIRDIFSTADTPEATQPITYIDGDEPPLLLITGKADHVVDPGNSQRLADKMTSRGGEARTIFYPNIGHSRILISIADPLTFIAPTRKDIIEFINP
ncbi:MAG: carboxylesterase [marine bacterium B5-7]|nr:MAG: carboxylesterase [marine bacterium B5-7]